MKNQTPLLSNAQLTHIKRTVASWPSLDQTIFISLYVHGKPKDQVAHDMGIPFTLLDNKVDEMMRAFRSLPESP